MLQGPVLVRGFVTAEIPTRLLCRALDKMSARHPCDFRRAVGAIGIVHKYVVGPTDRLQAAGEVPLFVFRGDKDGNHFNSRSATPAAPRPTGDCEAIGSRSPKTADGAPPARWHASGPAAPSPG